MNDQNNINLYACYKRATKEKKDSGVLHSWYLPLLVTLSVCIVAFCVIVNAATKVETQLEKVVAWNTDPVNLDEFDYSMERQDYNDQIVAHITEVNELNDVLAGYPVFDATLMRQIEKLGGSKITNVISGYYADSGTLNFIARSEEVINIPEYVEIVENTGYFENVTYLGYTFTDGEYNLSMSVVLKSGLGK